jgi:hypothetical protein
VGYPSTLALTGWLLIGQQLDTEADVIAKFPIFLHYQACVKTLVRPYPEFWAVDPRVGNVRNDSPDLFAPLNGAQK